MQAFLAGKKNAYQRHSFLLAGKAFRDACGRSFLGRKDLRVVTIRICFVVSLSGALDPKALPARNVFHWALFTNGKVSRQKCRGATLSASR
jgi:hypothetical protein